MLLNTIGCVTRDDYTDRPAVLGTLWRGIRRRCPVCGERAIFRSFLRLRRDCGGCGWLLEREPGTATGAMYLVAILSQFFAVFVLVAMFFTDWSTGLKLVVALPVIALFSLLALPMSKGIWVAVEYLTDCYTGRTSDPNYRNRAFDAERGER